jgi:hypothetical protein
VFAFPGLVSSPELAAAQMVTGDTVVLFKNFDEGRNDLSVEGLTVDAIKKHVQGGSSLSTLTLFEQKLYGLHPSPPLALQTPCWWSHPVVVVHRA